jgi:hypothetical protein
MHFRDGATNHAVTIVGKWVFDSNGSTAKELSQETLDWCCSSDNKKEKFVGVFQAIRFSLDNPRSEFRNDL